MIIVAFYHSQRGGENYLPLPLYTSSLSSMKRIFWSWQERTPNIPGRRLVRSAIEMAADNLGTAVFIEEPDRRSLTYWRRTERQNIPDPGGKIFDGIRKCDVFVADVTGCGAVAGEPSPPGNVLLDPHVSIELDFARSILGDLRIILVENRAPANSGHLHPLDGTTMTLHTFTLLPGSGEGEFLRVRGSLQASLTDSIELIHKRGQPAVEGSQALQLPCIRNSTLTRMAVTGQNVTWRQKAQRTRV